MNLNNIVSPNNWFTDNLPYEIGKRLDGQWNVWHMKVFKDEDGDSDLKWYVVNVFDTKEDAENFITSKKV